MNRWVIIAALVLLALVSWQAGFQIGIAAGHSHNTVCTAQVDQVLDNYESLLVSFNSLEASFAKCGVLYDGLYEKIMHKPGPFNSQKGKP